MTESVVMAVSHPQAINKAAAIINSGGLIAFPTDTVYGIGASAFHFDAIERIYQVKGRSSLKAIPILLGNAADAEQITTPLSSLTRKLAEVFWPGPLTLVVPLLSSLPTNLSPTPTIGLRVPDHEFTLRLLQETGPLAATSANLSGESSAISADEVQTQVGGKLDLILDGGRSPGGMASTVLDCTGEKPVLLREGPLSWDEIQITLHDATR
jgi:tRNA threonylcarbamoyl adenosine modification protein (Sua5/YciO/YrdC/YwlC family)